jgi:hypothetical protein
VPPKTIRGKLPELESALDALYHTTLKSAGQWNDCNLEKLNYRPTVKNQLNCRRVDGWSVEGISSEG